MARGQQVKQRATTICPGGSHCFSASGWPWCLPGRQQCPTLWRSTPGRSPRCCDERPLAAPQPDTPLSIASGKEGLLHRSCDVGTQTEVAATPEDPWELKNSPQSLLKVGVRAGNREERLDAFTSFSCPSDTKKFSFFSPSEQHSFYL